MIYITSHGLEFGVTAENTHNGDWTDQAAAMVKASLDDMGAERVAAIHANVLAVAAGTSDEFCDDYEVAVNAGCLANAYPDFFVALSAYR
jgi:hypothetical protein